MQQERVNTANRILDSVVCRNERVMPFEVFSSKIQKAVDTLEECGRAPHDGDVVDTMWKKIQNPELVAYVEALKVYHNQNPRPFRETLTSVAQKIPNLKKVTFQRNVSEVKFNAGITSDSKCRMTGVYVEGGKLCAGSYPRARQFDEDVKPCYDQIRRARNKNFRGKPGKKEKSGRANQNKIVVKKLQTRISELKKNSGQGENDEKGDQSAEENSDDAGDSFSGRKAKKKVRILKIITGARFFKEIKVQALFQKVQVFVDLTELDSHSDTIVAGKNTLFISHTDRVCEASPCSDECESTLTFPQ